MGALSNRKTFNSILFLSTSTRGRTKLWIHVLLFLFCYLVFCLFVCYLYGRLFQLLVSHSYRYRNLRAYLLLLILAPDTSLLFTSSLLHSCVCFICFPCFSFYFAWQQTSCFVFFLVSFSLGGVRFFLISSISSRPVVVVVMMVNLLLFCYFCVRYPRISLAK